MCKGRRRKSPAMEEEEEAHHTVWKVFFPFSSLGSLSGICLGRICHQRHHICIVGIAHASNGELSDQLSHINHSEDVGVQMVGVWVNERPDSRTSDSDTKPTLKSSNDLRNVELLLHQGKHADIPDTKLHIKHGRTKSLQTTLFILYDERQLLATNLHQWVTHSSTTKKLVPSHTSTEIYTENSIPQDRTDIEESLHTIQRSLPELRRLKSDGKVEMSCDILSDHGWNWIRSILSVLWHFFSMQLRMIFNMLDLLLDNRLFQNRVVWWLVRFPATGCQLIGRCKSLKSLIGDDCDSVPKAKSDVTDTRESETLSERKYCTNQRRGNILLCMAVDIVLGLLVMLWLQHNHLPDMMADWIMTWANITGGQLERLLQWLMGNPAGLKLNSALAHFLGHFFLYHVYLWLGYLTVLHSFLSLFIWCMALSGCLGLSVLLAVASDMLAILTFHIYCFYVYAAKIYNLQMSSLLSLSRLFRGKKWNVLRRRVDSCSYDIDQLFIGTLLFTMLLFLLPTTALFYTVFTMLRIVLLIVQSVLTKLVHVLNTLPVYSILLWLMKSDTLTDAVEFDVRTQLDDRLPYLIMKVQMMSLSKVVHIGQESFCASYSYQTKAGAPKKTMVDIGTDLLRGNLIYPWGG